LLGVGERGGWLPKWPWSRLAALIFGMSGRPPGGRAQIVQHLLAKEARISLPAFASGNDPLCDYVIGEIGSVSESKGYESHFEREAP